LRYQYLTREQVVAIHEEVIMKYGGSEGIISESNIELAISRPNSVLFGYEPFRTLTEKAAVLFHDIDKLHPFVDGNKRTAYTAADIFLRLNGKKIQASTEAAVFISLETAKCSADILQVTDWINKHTSKLSKLDSP
jgi:death-on-curing protein